MLTITGTRRHWIVYRAREHESVDPSVFVPRMLEYWRDVRRLGPRTIDDWLNTALDFDRYEQDLRQIELHFGSLTGKRVLDVGCGWGTFLTLLCQRGAKVEACDVPATHVEVAQLRAPEARVIQGDARSLSPYENETFDFVLDHDVFEHVGDHTRDTGPMSRSYPDKLRNLLALKRVLKTDGRGFISTGNFAFPFNGEVQLWAVHFLSFADQERYLQSVGIESDRYWLCTWAELQRVFTDAGLVIEHVDTPRKAALEFRDRFMRCLKGEPGVNREFGAALLNLMITRPEFMPSWLIFFRKD